MPRYRVIYADPPWEHACWSGKKGEKRTADSHYEHMTSGSLVAMGSWVQSIADPEGSYLFMWATGANIIEALALGEKWGYRFKTIAFVWVKLNKLWYKRVIGLFREVVNEPSRFIKAPHLLFDEVTRMVMGHYTRAQSEFVLLFTRGRTTRFRQRNIRQVVYAAVTDEHSEKPHRVRELIEAEFGSDVPKIELFSRHHVVGWAAHGHEVGKLDGAR